MSEKQIIQWMAIGSLLMGCLFFGIGSALISISRRKRKFCTTPVNAWVVDLVRDSTISRGNVSYYCPIFEYYFGGEMIHRKSTYGNTRPIFEIGESVELYIDPDKSTKIYCEKETKQSRTISVIFDLVGILLLIVGVMMGWAASST